MCGSVVERFPDKKEVLGPIPSTPTLSSLVAFMERNTSKDTPSFKKTAQEAVALSLQISGLQTICEYLDIPSGGIAYATEEVSDDVDTNVGRIAQVLNSEFVYISIIAPIKEEIESRLIPLVISKRFSPRFKLLTRFLATAEFALGHIINYDPEEDRNYYNIAAVPLPQIILAGRAWDIAKERGITHAILFHSIYNAATYIESLIEPSGVPSVTVTQDPE